MITEKDFKFVGIKYYNKNLAFDPTYSHTDVTFSNGGCSLARLKNPWKRFWVTLSKGIDEDLLTDKNYKDRGLKLTCSREKLADLTSKEIVALKDKVVKTLNAWKLNVQDVLIYAV